MFSFKQIALRLIPLDPDIANFTVQVRQKFNDIHELYSIMVDTIVAFIPYNVHE